jgi:integrase
MLLFNSMDIQYWFRLSKYPPDRPDYILPSDTFGAIYVRIVCQKQRLDITTTGVDCWRSEFIKGKVRLADADLIREAKLNGEIRKVVNRLDDVKESLDKHFLAEGLDPQAITAYDIKKAYLRVQDNKVAAGITVTEVIIKWNEQQIRRFESKEISNSTRSARHYYCENLKSFFTQHRKSDPQVRDLTEGVLDEVKYYLSAKRKLKPAYVAKHLRTIKEIMLWAKKSGEIRSNPVKEYRIVGLKQEYDTTCLSDLEIRTLWSFDPGKLDPPLSGKIAKVLIEERDALLFTCVTGMHDADYKSKHYIIEEDDLGFWLSGKRGKTGTKFKVPVDPIGIAILNKYGSIENLPKRSNKLRNETLKIIGALAKIRTYMTTKIGRKTFADRMLNELGYDPMDVALMLGQRNTTHLKHYVRIRVERLASKFKPRDMDNNEAA